MGWIWPVRPHLPSPILDSCQQSVSRGPSASPQSWNSLEMKTLTLHPEPLSQNRHWTRPLGTVWELPSGPVGQQVGENMKARVWETVGENVDPKLAQEDRGEDTSVAIPRPGSLLQAYQSREGCQWVSRCPVPWTVTGPSLPDPPQGLPFLRKRKEDGWAEPPSSSSVCRPIPGPWAGVRHGNWPSLKKCPWSEGVQRE